MAVNEDSKKFFEDIYRVSHPWTRCDYEIVKEAMERMDKHKEENGGTVTIVISENVSDETYENDLSDTIKSSKRIVRTLPKWGLFMREKPLRYRLCPSYEFKTFDKIEDAIEYMFSFIYEEGCEIELWDYEKIVVLRDDKPIMFIEEHE